MQWARIHTMIGLNDRQLFWKANTCSPSLFFRISIGTQVTCTYITWLSQPIEICSITTRPSSHVLEASIKTPKEILFCKQTGLYIVHTKWGLVVLYVYFYLENQFCVFQTAPVVVYRLMTSVFSTTQHRCWCYWLSRCLCKHFTFWRMTQNIVKTSLVMWHRAIKSI